jgi:hypothetical protein
LVRRALRNPLSLVVSIGRRTTVQLDNQGIPITNYGGLLGKQRNPVNICQRALKYEADYRDGNGDARRLFLNCAGWLVDNASDYGSHTIWQYEFPWKSYGMTPPWRSAMAQGLGVQVMGRALTLTGDDAFLTAGRTALASFFASVEERGVTRKSEEGWWYEEYAHECGLVSRVLNGMIFAVLGIHEWHQRSGASDALFLVERGLAALRAHLADYDEGSWTYYDALRNLASLNYHRIHVEQLGELYDMSGDSYFRELQAKWARYSL